MELQSRPVYRPRQSHQKSRTGCLTCKQRRIRCDEKRPTCTQCQSSLRTCTYSTESTKTLNLQSSSAASPSISLLPMPLGSPLAGSRGSFPTSSNILPELHEPQTISTPTNFSDSDLHQHYLEHTSKLPPPQHKDRAAMHVEMASLAQKSEPVSHSILALSAACMCCDMISQRNADPRVVSQALSIGLQHHTSAIEQMQAMASRPKESNAEALLANATLLVPFAFAFQHINYWVLFNYGSHENNPSVTPRDAVALLRGINTIILALSFIKAETSAEARPSQSNSLWNTTVSSQTSDPRNFQALSRTHLMFPILQAFSRLQHKIEIDIVDSQREENVVCAGAAFEILNDIVRNNLSTSEIAVDFLKYVTKHPLALDNLLAEVPAWLRCFASREPRPSQTEPLSRTFMAFFYCAPKAYIDLLFPLLDQRAGNLAGTLSDSRSLSSTEILALDIYAHWLVLMFLVEDEAWWLGNFPIVALQGLIRSYGDKLLRDVQEKWWPRSMLEIMIELRLWK